MSYQFSSNIRYKRPEDEEDYSNIDDKRKEQIMKELQEEMDKLKVKYLLEDKNKNSMNNTMNNSQNNKFRGGDSGVFANSFKDKGDETYNVEIEETVTSQNRIPEIRELETMRETELNTNTNINIYTNSNNKFKNNSKGNNFAIKNKNQFLEKEDSLLEEDYNNDIEDVEVNFKNSKFKSNTNKEIQELESTRREPVTYHNHNNNNSDNGNNASMFDKAKENLMKIKNELEDMDQYDYRKIPAINKSKINLENSMTKNEVEIDECYIEEEKPKNFEHELSMSKSLKEDFQYIPGYKFNTPYVGNLTNMKYDKQKNNYMPLSFNNLNRRKSKERTNSSSRLTKSKSTNKIRNNNCGRNIKDEDSGSIERERKNSLYFKK
jgi:hypothetical protein